MNISYICERNYNHPFISIHLIEGFYSIEEIKKKQEEVSNKLIELLDEGKFNRLDNGILFVAVSGWNVEKQRNFLEGVKKNIKTKKDIPTKIRSNSSSFLGFNSK